MGGCLGWRGVAGRLGGSMQPINAPVRFLAHRFRPTTNAGTEDVWVGGLWRGVWSGGVSGWEGRGGMSGWKGCGVVSGQEGCGGVSGWEGRGGMSERKHAACTHTCMIRFP